MNNKLLNSIQNLNELLEHRSRFNPNDIAYIFVEEHCSDHAITYRQLHERAMAIALRLKKLTKRNDRVLLIYPPGIELITAYFGCLYAGVVCVPVYPPNNDVLVDKIQMIYLDCEPSNYR